LIFGSFGAFFGGKTTGIIYNNEMDDFSIPGAANIYGLPPSPSNYIKPGKRPMSSMSPIIVVDENDDIRLVLGASGGSRIITGVASVCLPPLFHLDSNAFGIGIFQNRWLLGICF
jgi:gamma-glutamyltranspeptidase/glutathione hydrolase/leukotriene-C4 hydrolase